ncbi:MAG TPA: AAA domain-containing protein, partial [Gemmataceae bacterium]|nr:AAA domain-containing protein [Gemmataceae bacterium]
MASRQGLLYAHQLPRGGNGTRPPTAAEDARGLQLLSRLLQGQIADLEPVRADSVDVFDSDLDARQRDAVARALASPDVCLIQGLPGTGKSRVVAELVTRAAARGDRVLLAASGAAAIDRVLELVAGRDVLCPIRCLGQGERPEGLLPAARAVTFTERVRTLKENALTAAVRTREQAEQRCQHLCLEEALWPRLVESARQHQQLLEETRGLQVRREQVPAELEQVALRCDQASAEAAPQDDPFAVAALESARQHREALTRLEAAHADAQRQHAERKQALDALSAQMAGLVPLADAKTSGRWWSPSWWRATFKGDVPTKLAALRTEHETAQGALTALEQQLEEITRQRQAAEEDYQKERRQRLTDETARRQAALDEQLVALVARTSALEADWQKECAVLELEKLRPAALTDEAVGVARELWKAQQQEDDQRCTFARQWATYLEESADSLTARLPGYANLVATTLAVLPQDVHFGDAAATGGQFDLLVLEEAETVTEAELLRLARRARRWVLVGEPGPFASSDHRGEAPRNSATGHHPRSRAKPPSSSLARANVFHRLWQTLHCDPTRLPYTWVQEQDRLCCRLRQLAPEQRQWLESEYVADFPEVELRILALPRVRPLLAEVIFPPSMTIEQAKGYIYQELQELPVQAAERCLRWTDEPDLLALCLCSGESGQEAAVALEPGVRELVATAVEGWDGQETVPQKGQDTVPQQARWYTRRVEFERAAGWTRHRAEEWLQTHLSLRDLGRTALLETPYRMTPDLAAILSELLFEGAYRLPPAAACPGESPPC